MKLSATLSLAAIAGLLSGCAMTPEEQDRFRANFMQGLSAGQPAYQAPVYQQPQRMRTTDCIRTFNGGMSCTSY